MSERCRSTRRPGHPRNASTEQDRVPIQLPQNLDQMLQNWIESEEPNVGWCLLCDQPIRSAEDLLPGTSTHDCTAGRALEERIESSVQGTKNQN